MITKRMLLILGTVQGLNEISLWTPFKWDKVSQRMKLSPTWRFIGYQAYTFYLSCFVGVIAIRVVVAFGNQTKYELKHTLVDFCFLSIITANLSIAKLVITDRKDYAEWINQTIQLDRKLQLLSRQGNGKVKTSTSVQRSLEIQKLFTECLMALIASGCLCVVALVALLFVEGSDPMYRFLLDVFGIRVTPKLSHLPIYLGIVYLLWLCTGTVQYILYWGLLQLHTCAYWLKAMAPVVQTIRQGHHGVSRESKFNVRKTAIGYVNDRTCLRVHKSLEVLMKFSMMDKPIVAIHVGCCFVIIVAAGFGALKLLDKFGMPAYLVCPVTTILCLCVIDFESILYSVVSSASENALLSIKKSYGRKSLPAKQLRGHKVINVTPGKPFFVMGKAWSLEFNRIVADYIIDVIMSTRA